MFTGCEILDQLIFDSDEEREEEEFLIVCALADQYIQEQENKRRPTFYVRDRLEWGKHVEELVAEGDYAFSRLYRMEYHSFSRLCDIIRPTVEVDEEMSSLRTGKGPITVEIMLHCLLRWLGGGSYLDIRLSAGISVASFYRCVYKCIDAILASDELSYSFPQGEEEIASAARKFEALSSNGAIKGCVACLDGYLLGIQVPSSKETGNVKAYFSGHYQAYGINVQAACDHKCRFVYVCVAAPGGVNDISAFRKTKLPQMIRNLPPGKFVAGDNAYVCSEHLLTPFSRDERSEARKDAYNFYLSQLRIRIEQAFGFMTTKWRILKRPLQVDLKRVGYIFLCIARLHNFCINEGCDVEGTNDRDAEGATFVPSDISVTEVKGSSMLRDTIVEELAQKGLGRPQYNLERNGAVVNN